MQLEYATLLKLKETLQSAYNVNECRALLTEDEEQKAVYYLVGFRYQMAGKAIRNTPWDHDWELEEVEQFEALLREFAEEFRSRGDLLPAKYVNSVADMVALHLTKVAIAA